MERPNSTPYDLGSSTIHGRIHYRRFPISPIFFCNSLSKINDFHTGLRVTPTRFQFALQKPLSLLQSPKMRSTLIVMRDRGKNRKPLQRGRVSIEAIQTIQALKRAKKDENSLKQVFETMFKRLVKLDMIVVLRDLQRQKETHLALQVFEEMRKEYWYKPQVLVYAEMITFLADNEYFDMAELVFMYMKMENGLEGGVKGFNALLTTFMDFGNVVLCVECYELMRKVGCEPDRLTFRILINGLESKGEYGLSVILRQEAEGYFGEDLEFLEETEEIESNKWPCW